MNILERVSHKNIIKIVSHYETDSTIYLVLELVSGGELFDYIVKCENVSDIGLSFAPFFTFFLPRECQKQQPRLSLVRLLMQCIICMDWAFHTATSNPKTFYWAKSRCQRKVPLSSN